MCFKERPFGISVAKQMAVFINDPQNDLRDPRELLGIVARSPFTYSWEMPHIAVWCCLSHIHTHDNVLIHLSFSKLWNKKQKTENKPSARPQGNASHSSSVSQGVSFHSKVNRLHLLTMTTKHNRGGAKCEHDPKEEELKTTLFMYLYELKA